MKQLWRIAILVVGVWLLPSAWAADHKLDGAYKFVSVTFSGGGYTEAQAKGFLIVHGKYWANVRATLDRKSWDQKEPEDERTKKVVAAFQGLTANCGTFEIDGNTVTMLNDVAANPGAIGTSSKWEFKLDGSKLTLKPLAAEGVEFNYERLP